MPTPYYEQPYDNSRRTARLSDLARMRADALANAELQAGQAKAQMIGGIGSAIGGTLADLARYQADAPARKAAAQAQGEAAARKDTLKMVASLPPEQQVAELRAAGLTEDANAAEDRLFRVQDRTERKEQTVLAGIRDRIENAKTIAGKGAALLGAVKEKPELWAEVRPQVVDLAAQIDPKMVDFIPQDSDPAALGEFVSSVNQMAESYSKTARAVKAADDALTRGGKLADVTKKFGEVLALVPPEQHESILAAFAQAGVPAAVLAGAPAAAKAGREKRTGEFGQYLDVLEQGLGRPLNKGDIEIARAKWQALGREPKDGPAPPKDDPALPGGVRTYLTSLLDKHKGDYQAAEAEWNRGLAEQQAKHPNLDPTKARTYLRSLFGAPTGGPQTDYMGEVKPFRASGFDQAPSAGPAPIQAGPTPPMGPTSAEASPVARPAPTGGRPMPKVGDVVTVRGQKVQITKIHPNGQVEGIPVP